jgi:hypothetical protein
MSRPYTIARLAAAETIRYYQRLRLVPEPSRPLGGIRRYTEADADRLRFIKGAQTMGCARRDRQSAEPTGPALMSRHARARCDQAASRRCSHPRVSRFAQGTRRLDCRLRREHSGRQVPSPPAARLLTPDIAAVQHSVPCDASDRGLAVRLGRHHRSDDGFAVCGL